ncbi:hypothetical protein BVX93_02180, partial [bacterium B13(2017)]
LKCGKSGIKNISLFNPGDLPSRIAGQCEVDFTYYKDRKINFAIHSIKNAILHSNKNAKIGVEEFYKEKIINLSIGIGLELFDMDNMIEFINNDYLIPQKKINTPDFLQTPLDFCISKIMDEIKLPLIPFTHISACAASTDAIGSAVINIINGNSKIAITGGTDSMINPLGLGGFCKLNALSTKNISPARSSSPFDLNRDGFVLGEGAAFFIIENYEEAKQRGAQIYGEILGYGNSFDAYSISDPHPEGIGALIAMEKAIKMSGISIDELSYINAHGTSTPKNDIMETIAIKRLLGDYAYKVPISSTKSMIGHLISAAGAVETLAALICANNSIIHPTINLRNPDPRCDLDYIPNQYREHKVKYFLKNSFAFGGMNASLLLKNMEN